MRQIYAKLSEVLLATEGALIVRYRGSWISGTNFVAGDLVDNSGAWFCTANNTGSAANEPGVGASYTDYWVPLQHVTVAAAQNFTATDTTPYARLVGSGGVYSIEMRLEGGILKFYDNIAGAVIAQMTNADGLVVTKENDHQTALDIAQGVSTVGTTGAIGGTWTVSEGVSDNIQKVARTAAVADHYYRIPISLPKRSTTNKGAKLKSVTMSYVVSGGASGDIIQLQILKQVLPLVDGIAATGVVLAGDDDADYDAGHNTDAARWAAGTHTLTVTIPTGEQAYAVAGEKFAVRVRVKDAATANLAFTITGLEATYAHSEY